MFFLSTANEGVRINKEASQGIWPTLLLFFCQIMNGFPRIILAREFEVQDRWQGGDPDVVQAMLDFAGYAQEAKDLIEAGRGEEIGPLLDANFNRRCSIYNMDPGNVDMVERARSVKAPPVVKTNRDANPAECAAIAS